MPEFRLKPEAESDLAAIWRWTCAQWSPAQADTYVDTLDRAMTMLAKDPARGRRTGEVDPDLFRQRCVSHVIFYRAAVHGIDVIRVLHVRMNWAAHLKDSP